MVAGEGSSAFELVREGGQVFLHFVHGRDGVRAHAVPVRNEAAPRWPHTMWKPRHLTS
jgi:hypothetical protein